MANQPGAGCCTHYAQRKDRRRSERQGLSMLALVSSELADRDRRAVISLDRGPQRPQASQAAKCLQPITLRSQDRAEPAGDAFESLRQRQLIHERSRQTQAELAYAAG